jgi:hypothetical protein
VPLLQVIQVPVQPVTQLILPVIQPVTRAHLQVRLTTHQLTPPWQTQVMQPSLQHWMVQQIKVVHQLLIRPLLIRPLTLLLMSSIFLRTLSMTWMMEAD